MNKEKTLSLLANRICEECAKKADDPDVVKHGCCIHFIDSIFNELHPPMASSAGGMAMGTTQKATASVSASLNSVYSWT